MHFPEHINIKRAGGSLTVEAALLLPLIIIVLTVFLGLLRGLIGYQFLSSAVYDCADMIAEYSILYETIGLDRVHRKLLEEETEEPKKSEEMYFEAEGIQISVEETDFLESAIQKIYPLLQQDLKKIIQENLYFLFLNKAGEAIAKGFLSNRIRKFDLEEAGIRNGIDGISFEGTKLFYQDEAHGALIHIRLSYQPELFPGGAWITPEPVEIEATVHAFLGENPFGTDLQADEIFYRIGMGEKYHSLDCYLIDKDIHSLTLWEAQQQGYKSCRRCRSWENTQVWVTSGGERYHRKECSYLYPQLEEVTSEQIKELGLEPCELCQGEGGGFP